MATLPATVLVTGAMGQLGRLVCSLLLQRGRTVVALDLDTPSTRAAALELAETSGSGTLVPAYVDLTDAGAVRAAVAEHRPNVVVHLAAMVSPPCYRNPSLARRVNVEGTGNLVAAAAELVPQPGLVQASSAAVYGPRNPYLGLGRISPL